MGGMWPRKRKFFKKYSSWLDEPITISLGMDNNTGSTAAKTTSVGRPPKDFASSSIRSKRRKVENLASSSSTQELVMATEQSLRRGGKSSAAKLVPEALNTIPTRAEKIKKVWKSAETSPPSPSRYTPDEALALMLDCDLSTESYKTLKKGAKNKAFDMYPAFNPQVTASKERCYPPENDVTITETTAQIRLQALVDLTGTRIVESKREQINEVLLTSDGKFTLISKWGCDGSGGHALYKQKCVESDRLKVDSNLHMTCLVPLRLYSVTEQNPCIIWDNPSPSSVRYCRPVEFRFTKETEEVVLELKNSMDEQINGLQCTKIADLCSPPIEIQHSLHMTMIDGKTYSILTGTPSSQTCYMCGATPKVMNEIDYVLGLTVNETVSQYGVSNLHAWIRFFEWMYHLAIRMEFKKWCIRQPIKEIASKREKLLQQEIRSRLGILVGVVVTGKGSIHDGNTARRFFENAEVVSEICGIDLRILKRCSVILRVLSCKFEIDAQAFHEYSLETARLYVELYEWFPIPAGAHKVLFHGGMIISKAMLPIGMFSESGVPKQRFSKLPRKKMSKSLSCSY